MVNRIDTSNNFAADIKDLGKLRQAAKENSPEALKATAKQFEALFMNMVLKSMREATPQEGVFDSQQSKMYTSMFDQQLSQTMASRGVGLADVLVRQLSTVVDAQKDAQRDAQKAGVPSEPAGLSKQAVDTALKVMQISPPADVPKAASSNKPAHVLAFQDKLGAAAEDASRATGIPAKFMLGQAALESGWGRREIKSADGTNSFNVFGIKATGAWNGKVVETATTEYVNGVPRTKIEKFRAYDSYADAFKDYAKLLTKNPRYEAVLANAKDITGFAQGLQKAGYATDPHYADKLTRIIKHSLSA